MRVKRLPHVNAAIHDTSGYGLKIRNNFWRDVRLGFVVRRQANAATGHVIDVCARCKSAIQMVRNCAVDGVVDALEHAGEQVFRAIHRAAFKRGEVFINIHADAIFTEGGSFFDGTVAHASAHAKDDIRAVLLPALRHRVILSFEAEADGMKADKILSDLLAKVT